MVREHRMRIGSDERSTLVNLRETSDKYDSNTPLGFIVGQLAEEKLVEFLNDDDSSEVQF